MSTHHGHALLLAAAAGDVHRVRAAIEAGAESETRDGRRRTPLLPAASHDHVGRDTPWLVTGRHVRRRVVDPASERGHVDYVRRAVQTGIDVDHVNRLGWTVLLEAVILGREKGFAGI